MTPPTPHSLRHARRAPTLALAAIAASLAWAPMAGAGSPADISHSPASWIWPPHDIVGASRLIRTDTGISANLETSGLPPGHAMTLWAIVFNRPENCFTVPCSLVDLFGVAAEADFLFLAGNVVGGNGRAHFGGHRALGDNSGSGMIEIGLPELAVGLTNPRGAEVHLVVHSHGPAVPGQTLKAQINSFLGGCQVFTGNADGIAEGFADIPANVGECSSIQASIHF